MVIPADSQQESTVEYWHELETVHRQLETANCPPAVVPAKCGQRILEIRVSVLRLSYLVTRDLSRKQTEGFCAFTMTTKTKRLYFHFSVRMSMYPSGSVTSRMSPSRLYCNRFPSNDVREKLRSRGMPCIRAFRSGIRLNE